MRPCDTAVMVEVDDERITPALHALLSGDATGLRTAINADPEITDASWNGNTLLEWSISEQVALTPEIVGVFLDCGTRFDRALNLAACWNRAELCQELLSVGADPAARADADITPLESAAMHGSNEAADVLVAHGLHRPSLWLAAASGQLDLVRDWVSPDGKLTQSPGVYRPDWAAVGRTEGDAPTDDPDEILGEAFVFAAANDRRAVVDYLNAAGIDINARPYRNTMGLHVAIQFRKPDMVEQLIHLGADLSILDDEYHSDATGWAAACDDGSPEATRILALINAAQFNGSESATEADT